MSYVVHVVEPREPSRNHAVQVPTEPDALAEFAAWAEKNVRSFGRYEVDQGELWLGFDEMGHEIYAQPGDWLVGFEGDFGIGSVWTDKEFTRTYQSLSTEERS